MQITVTTLSDDMFTAEVSDELELTDFKALCEMESGVPATEMVLVSNGEPLNDEKRKLKDYGIRDGDVLLLQRIQGRGRQTPGQAAAEARPPGARGAAPIIDFSQVLIPGAGASTSSRASNPQPAGFGGGAEDPATLRELLLSSPHDLALLKERNPPLSEALLSGSLPRFTEVLRQQQSERAERERERIRLFNADPFDSDAQSRIAEEIRLKNVESNMEHAMEHAPESFGQVVMLYIDCTVNGHPVKAFVDSGAQMTIMSQECAERCNINRLVDTRWAGIAKGIGTQAIIGRVHLCQIQIGPVFLQCSFSILKDQPMDMLLGLDMLKRHQCIINLRDNELVIGTTNTHTSFLCEADLPEHARNRNLSSSNMDEDQQMLEAMARSHEDRSSISSGARSRSPQHPATRHQTATFPESIISQLTSNGFSRQAAIDELTRTNGNVDEALAALIAKSFSIPP